MRGPYVYEVHVLASRAGCGLPTHLPGPGCDIQQDQVFFAPVSHEIDVSLTLTDSKLVIKSMKGTELDLEIPCTAIDGLSYEALAHRRARDVMPTGIPPFDVTVLIMNATKSKSYWLAIEHHDRAGQKVTLLRLDKSEHQNVVEALQAKSGKQLKTLEFKTSSLSNPTAGSKDMDEVVAFGTDKIMAALKPAMERLGCKVTEATASRIKCKRSRGKSEQTGTGNGGESVTATLDPEGEQTRIRISTGLGFYGRVYKKNWSTPIFQEMMRNLTPE
jgi:hypothetical protein